METKRAQSLDLSFLEDSLSIASMEGAFKVVRQDDWEALKEGNELSDLKDRLNKSVPGGHSGGSMSWTCFQLKTIAQEGYENWKSLFMS